MGWGPACVVTPALRLVWRASVSHFFAQKRAVRSQRDRAFARYCSCRDSVHCEAHLSCCVVTFACPSQLRRSLIRMYLVAVLPPCTWWLVLISKSPISCTAVPCIHLPHHVACYICDATSRREAFCKTTSRRRRLSRASTAPSRSTRTTQMPTTSACAAKSVSQIRRRRRSCVLRCSHMHVSGVFSVIPERNITPGWGVWLHIIFVIVDFFFTRTRPSWSRACWFPCFSFLASRATLLLPALFLSCPVLSCRVLSAIGGLPAFFGFAFAFLPSAARPLSLGICLETVGRFEVGHRSHDAT